MGLAFIIIIVMEEEEDTRHDCFKQPASLQYILV